MIDDAIRAAQRRAQADPEDELADKAAFNAMRRVPFNAFAWIEHDKEIQRHIKEICARAVPDGIPVKGFNGETVIWRPKI